jgi:hypothetical protein
MTIDEATLSDLQAKHGEVYEITVDGHSIYVRKPTRPHYVAWKTESYDPQKRMYASENLLRSCTVYPEPKEFSAFLQREPFLADVFAGELLEIAGSLQKAEVKKL